jgi:hypothetical protein
MTTLSLAARTLHPSCPHPYGVAFPASAVPTLPGIALAGYAAQHAPTASIGQRMAVIAMRTRNFDRNGGRKCAS